MTGKSQHNRDLMIVEALARGECQTAAARLAGCSVATIRRRMEAPAFRGQVDRFRADMLDAAAGLVGTSVSESVTTLRDLLAPTQPPAIRLGAARALIDSAIRLREAVDWERRLSILESQIPKGEAT